MTDVAAGEWEGEGAAALAPRWGAPAVHLFQEVGSTNDVARRLAERGAEHGTVVLAERQLAGRGRAGRSWSSPPGLGLWFTLICRPPSPAALGVLPIRVGLAVSAALDPVLEPERAQLKWPNDLIVRGRKLGGILCEAAWAGAALSAAVVGVGLNLNHAASDFPEEVAERATSAALAAGRPLARLAVADAVIPAVLRALAGGERLAEPELAAYASRDALADAVVRVTDPVTGAALEDGLVLGVSADGALLLRTPAGVLRRVRSGTVRTTTLSA